ncbi:hypothetical protein TSOC_014477 [Tetrabaena socialis]|uniref:Uncharacterized protein n=1 Tax=Tetrabaena socialis TaxID=47790 RepID=A0A2J7ZHN2_9CHLO|nr:hypothetical protein TSOC_014477 [Tetrabaena socialis]|eukprot:PNG99739.1 hypothetical protein TSOC_014477 [Tetrabaena socialis]
MRPLAFAAQRLPEHYAQPHSTRTTAQHVPVKRTRHHWTPTAPYFLSRGRHIQQDIPLLVAQAAEAHPGLSCVIADPIGLAPLMAQLISNRVATALEGRSGSGPLPTATLPLPPPVAGTQPPTAAVEAEAPPSAAVAFAITAVAAVATAAAAFSSLS